MIGRVLTVTLFAFLVQQTDFAATADDPQSRQQELEALRQEISRTRQKIEESRRKEQGLIDVVSGLDREVDLTRKLLGDLQSESERKQRQIAQTRREIRRMERQLKRLQGVYRKRAVSYYKRGRVPDLELLLKGLSLHKTLVWLKFERLLAERDQREYQRIVENKRQLEARKQILELHLREHQRLMQEKSQEEKTLRARRAERQKLLQQVREDRGLYEQRLRQIEEAAAEIRRLISQDEQRRARRGSRPVPGRVDFAQLKGKLPWPVQGKVVLHFGRYKHPRFKTVTENLGIDIRAPMGAPVQTVCDGRVTAITWQRGRGNIVIVHHAGGYYTVYTHLADILVGLDEEVVTGQTVGTVGDTGSLEGPKLHFQIWHNTKNLDPEQWLRS